MDTSKILAELRAERDQINQAIAVLESLGGIARAAKAAPVKTKPGGEKRAISRAGRNRIAEAARKRWAAVRSAKTAPAAAPPAKGARPPMSAATKQKLAKAAKERWAKRKAKPAKPGAKLVKAEAKAVNPEVSANQVATAQTASKRAKGTRRNLTAAARKAMSEAAKARWANKTEAAKTS